MKRIACFAFASAAILVSCSNTARTPMPHPALELRTTPLQPASADQLNSLRLTSDGKRISLAGMTASRDGMHAVSIRASETDRLEAPQPLGELPSPFGTPFWDLAPAGSGFAKVWTKPGSAISALGYQAPGQGEVTLTGKYPMGVFQHPRFVRGDDSRIAITACALQPEGEALVLFQEDLASGQSRFRVLPAAGPGALLDGLLLRAGKGFLLLAKYAAPSQSASQRIDLRGENATGGVFRCLWLDAELRALDSAFSPFGDSAVFEFDADADGGFLYVLSTSVQGYAAAAAVIRDEAWSWTFAAMPFPKEETLLSPAVTARKDSAAIAFLAVDASGSRKILRGRMSVQER